MKLKVFIGTMRSSNYENELQAVEHSIQVNIASRKRENGQEGPLNVFRNHESMTKKKKCWKMLCRCQPDTRISSG